MKILTRKWVHTGLISLIAVLTDVGAQLASGSINPTRAVIVGLVVGGLARVAGAILAASYASDEPQPLPKPSIDIARKE